MTQVPVNLSTCGLLENSTSEALDGGSQTIAYWVQVSLAIIVILGNGLIILTIRMSRRLRAIVYWLTMNVAVADMVVGVSILVRQLIFATGVLHGSVFQCIPNIAIAICGASWSLCSVCLLSFERLLTIIKPTRLQWPLKRKGKPIKILAATIALASTLLAISSSVFVQRPASINEPYCVIGGTFIHSGYWLTLAGIISVLMVCVIASHSYTLIHAKQNLKELRESVLLRTNPFDSHGPTGLICGHVSVIASNPPQLPRIKNSPQQLKATGSSPDEFELRYALMNMRITMVVTMVLVIMVVCWLPTMFMLYIVHGCGSWCGIKVATLPWTGSLVILNSIINIVVYSLRLRHFRREMWAVLKCRRRREIMPWYSSRRIDDVISVVATGHPSSSECGAILTQEVSPACQICSPSEVNLVHIPRRSLIHQCSAIRDKCSEI